MTLGIFLTLAGADGVRAQEMAPTPRALPSPVPAPSAEPGDRPLPINLATALQLANARPLDIALASQRVQTAAAQLERARVLWLPTIFIGPDYFRHDGQIQAVDGTVFGTSKSSFMLGAGPFMVFAVSDAIFQPLAARQVVRAREAEVQAARNDTLRAVAESYFNVQQARGELIGALDAAQRAEDLTQRASKLAPGLAPPVEVVRARAELAERRQDVHTARERWRVASAELARLLRLDRTALVEPLEPPHLQVSLVEWQTPVDDLIPIGLTNRPELARDQALIQATLARLRQEKIRPLVPSVLLRGASTPVAGTLGAGLFGGGLNSTLTNFGARQDYDLQVLWQLENLGFGNRGRIHESRAEHQAALLQLFRTQDFIAADIASAHAQVRAAAARVQEAEGGLRDARESFDLNLKGLGQTRQAGNLLLLVIRPQEVVAAVQALSRAYNRYYGAVADYNRAQFRLYWALGQPAQSLIKSDPSCAPTPNGTAPPAEPASPIHAPAPAASQSLGPTPGQPAPVSPPHPPVPATPARWGISLCPAVPPHLSVRVGAKAKTLLVRASACIAVSVSLI